MAIVLLQVAQTIAKYRMVEAGERVGVAVSGGADSVALLHCLQQLTEKLGIVLGVVHLNHKLRGRESDQDEEFVAQLASRMKLRLFTKSVDVPAMAQQVRNNLEQVGRNVRYQFFTELIRRARFEKIATGHTLSDQSETVLFRLLRGTGSAGLAAIRPVRQPGIIRPLIEVSREQIRDYLGSGGHGWREDSSNVKGDIARNRIRHELMPLLKKEWNPNLPAVLAQMAGWAQAEEAYWRDIIEELTPRYLEERGDAIYLRADAVGSLPVAVARRLVRAAIERTRGSLLGIRYEHVEAVRRLAAKPRGEGQAHLPGLEATRSFDQVRLAGSRWGRASQAGYRVVMEGPGSFPIPGTSCALVLHLLDWDKTKERGYNSRRFSVLDWERIPKPLLLRNWQPGDRFHPQGRAGAKKLKSLFQRSRIAVWERRGWPVIAAAAPKPGAAVPALSRAAAATGRSEWIVWVRGFGTAAEFSPNENSRLILEITEVGLERNEKFEI